MMDKIIFETKRQLTVVEDADVLVCGAGPAGVCAAIAAARAGAKTCLLESSGCLGGTWTSGLLGWIIDQTNKDGLLKELKYELCSRGGSEQPPESDSMPFDIETMKLLLEEKCLEAGVRIRLNTLVTGIVKSGAGKISEVITESKSGGEAWRGKVVIDATGDGDVGFLSGCRYELGNPGNGYTQPMSLLCLVTGLDFEKCRKYVIGYSSGHLAPKLALKAEMEAAGVSPSYNLPSLFLLTGGLYFMMGNHQYRKLGISADDITAATIDARREVNAQIAALRSLGGCWKNIRLVSTAERIGVREGRRIKGVYVVTAGDIAEGVRHVDAVCHVTFGFDVHAVDPSRNKGIDKSGLQSHPYDIPLRSLISADVPNLMMAGRCISGDFLAHSSYRVTGNAAALGEAAGLTAAIAAAENITPAQVPFARIKESLHFPDKYSVQRKKRQIYSGIIDSKIIIQKEGILIK